ncbi:MAG: VanZ family protein [Thermoanaerobaculia bacterium]
MLSLRTAGVHVLSLALAVAIAFALIEPVPPDIDAVVRQFSFPVDKLAHFGLFLVAAFPWRRSFVRLGMRSPNVAVVVAAAAYGGALEIAQGLWTTRDPEVLDMLAGALGALVAVALTLLVRSLRKNSERQGAPV